MGSNHHYSCGDFDVCFVGRALYRDYIYFGNIIDELHKEQPNWRQESTQGNNPYL